MFVACPKGNHEGMQYLVCLRPDALISHMAVMSKVEKDCLFKQPHKEEAFLFPDLKRRPTQ